MTEQTITCPKCNADIKLTESLAAPLIDSMKRAHEEDLRKKDAEIKRHETTLRQREEALQKKEDEMEETLDQRLRAERDKIAAEEAKRAKRALEADMEAKAREIAELNERMLAQTAKLADAQKAQAECLRKERELEEAKRELELNIEKRVAESLEAARDQARKQAEEELRLKVSEKEQTIASMQRQIEELKRRAEQGSQQLQGEVQELELEALLAAKFPVDTISPVPKGEFGGDVLQTVHGPFGTPSGCILWETKRTKNWSDGWLMKLKDDQRAAKAEVAIIISHTLPKDIESFDHKDGIWITHPRCAIPVAVALRHSLIETALARKAGEGQQTKMEEMYQYLTGPMFRQRVQVLVEAFTTMQDDLAKEKKAFQKQWAKREKELERVLIATAGMYGDLQGIAGKGIEEIEELSLAALEHHGNGQEDS